MWGLCVSERGYLNGSTASTSLRHVRARRQRSTEARRCPLLPTCPFSPRLTGDGSKHHAGVPTGGRPGGAERKRHPDPHGDPTPGVGPTDVNTRALADKHGRVRGHTSPPLETPPVLTDSRVGDILRRAASSSENVVTVSSETGNSHQAHTDPKQRDTEPPVFQGSRGQRSQRGTATPHVRRQGRSPGGPRRLLQLCSLCDNSSSCVLGTSVFSVGTLYCSRKLIFKVAEPTHVTSTG